MLQVLSQLCDDRQQRLLIGFFPREGLQEERDAMLVGRHPEDELLEITPAALGMTVGDGLSYTVQIFVCCTPPCNAARGLGEGEEEPFSPKILRQTNIPEDHPLGAMQGNLINFGRLL